ncbi:MAG: HEAT repeat domain-containing protein, partial [Actinomycetota bacterium]
MSSKLREQLRQRSPAARVRAINALGRLRTPEAVDLLCSALSDPDTEVRMEAADTLAKLGAASAVDALCRALTHRDRYTRIAAAEALGAIGDPRAVPRRRCECSGRGASTRGTARRPRMRRRA